MIFHVTEYTFEPHEQVPNLFHSRAAGLKFFFTIRSDIILLLEREIPPERITFLEELGRGAFGKVLRGALRELPTVEVFYKPRHQRVEIKEEKVVAIKTLLGV